ncbi:hypothetical protein [Bosea sp. (in: a-proteobacteria)]|uniref:hypothetical protein n=1 Tax=Bosea sp. (in: a-proteobacteria) TaxID=1871050 RepID=UPI003B3AABC0
MRVLTVGQTELFSGNVTTLNWIGPRPAAAIERNLGYAPGRLAQGYWVILLKQILTADDFEFDGTTLRSGGRIGVPAQSETEDAKRARIHDEVLREYGPAGYRELQMRALASVKLHGQDRIAKVVPVTLHESGLAPAEQYPMGGGGLQWNIKKPCRFLIAMHVSPTRIATLPGLTVSLTDGPKDDENRARVSRFLASA